MVRRRDGRDFAPAMIGATGPSRRPAARWQHRGTDSPPVALLPWWASIPARREDLAVNELPLAAGGAAIGIDAGEAEEQGLPVPVVHNRLST